MLVDELSLSLNPSGGSGSGNGQEGVRVNGSGGREETREEKLRGVVGELVSKKKNIFVQTDVSDFFSFSDS